MNVIIEVKKILNNNDFTMFQNECEKYNINNIEDIRDLLIDIIFEKGDFDIIVKLSRSLIAKRYPSLFSIESMERRYEILQKYEVCKIRGLNANHIEILQLFNQVNIFLNTLEVEYYHTSGFMAYLLLGKDLVRYHHDIDIFVDESRLQDVESNSSKFGFSFVRMKGDREDGTQRRIIKLIHNKYKIPITIFMFTENKDGSIIQDDYYYKDSNLFVDHIYNSSLCAKISFDKIIHFYNNIPYKSISLEALYASKLQTNRNKDKLDCEIIKNNINKQNLDLLLKELCNCSISTKKIVDTKIIKFFGENEDYAIKKV